MAKTRQRDSKGRFVRETLPTLEELNIRTQRISRGFYPDRTMEPDVGLSEEERITEARKLAALYEKLGEPIPAALLILI